ncbi:hypothetical protein QQF64_002713 [Cirrhinus molitorella]|uniref:Uncharacterized protein n=2 Tax=Cirrhinus molitorella TaxID=172907 RepID=A0AA88P6W7_9TELE|nr:hypothetical protein Q8A67_024042 [Cirrhinus molitorella]
MSEFWLCFNCCIAEQPQPKRRRRIDRSMIGEPTNFVHTAHVGSGDLFTGMNSVNSIQNQMQIIRVVGRGSCDVLFLLTGSPPAALHVPSAATIHLIFTQQTHGQLCTPWYRGRPAHRTAGSHSASVLCPLLLHRMPLDAHQPWVQCVPAFFCGLP